jgi:carboxymethylenebutenolidase
LTSAGGYLARAASGKSTGGVLLLHAWWGLNDTIKQMADDLAGHGYLVLAPDLFGGAAPVTTIEAAEALSGSRENDEDSQIALEQAVLGGADYLYEQTGKPIGAVGFSFGAAYALWLGVKRPDNLAGSVVFYGTYQGVGGTTPVQGHFAAEDPYEAPADVDEFEQHLRAAGRSVEFHRYPGTKHWFAEPDRPEYNADASSTAWRRASEFLDRELSG